MGWISRLRLGRENSMSFDLSLILSIALAAALIALVTRYALPKIELRGHSESHNGIRVREIAFTWLRRKRNELAVEDQAKPRWLECVVYVTLKSCNQ
jgi:hypothetical protein